MISIIFSLIFIFLDIFLFKLYFKIIFGNKESLNESLKYSITPDFYSLIKGKYMKDKISEFKLFMFIGLIIITIILEVIMVNQIQIFFQNL